MEELENILQEIKVNWSEAQKQQAAEDLNEIQGKVKKLIFKANTTAESLRLLADKLDGVWKKFKTAHAVGTGAGIAGGLLTLGGGVATFMTAGLASPLLVWGMAVGGAGAATNLTASRMEASINSKELEKAQKDLKETLAYVNIVNDTIQKWQDRKDVGRLLCIFSLALYTLRKTDPVIKILQKVFSHSSILQFSTNFLKNLKVVGTAGTKLAGQAAAGAADDVVGAALKTGGQAADDVVGAGVKAGANASKVAGGVIVGVSVVFLVWDTIDLSFTIRELIEERGSEAAKDLREKARQLEKECSFD